MVYGSGFKVKGAVSPLSAEPNKRIRFGPAELTTQIMNYHYFDPPHVGVRPFHQKSTCIKQFTLGPYVVQIWTRYARKFEPNFRIFEGFETLEAHRVVA